MSKAFPSGKVHSVSVSSSHVFSKSPAASINLLKNLGVEGDCHAGVTVQHLFRIKADPSQPNLRQVHFIALELLDEVNQVGEEGWGAVKPGDLGENITTSGIAILELGTGTKLHFLPLEQEEVEEESGHPVVEITGLRNPCHQIEKFRKGLQGKCVEKDPETKKVIKRKAGIMGVVVRGGNVEPGMRIFVEEPVDGGVPLEVV